MTNEKLDLESEVDLLLENQEQRSRLEDLRREKNELEHQVKEGNKLLRGGWMTRYKYPLIGAGLISTTLVASVFYTPRRIVTENVVQYGDEEVNIEYAKEKEEIGRLEKRAEGLDANNTRLSEYKSSLDQEKAKQEKLKGKIGEIKHNFAESKKRHSVEVSLKQFLIDGEKERYEEERRKYESLQREKEAMKVEQSKKKTQKKSKRSSPKKRTKKMRGEAFLARNLLADSSIAWRYVTSKDRQAIRRINIKDVQWKAYANSHSGLHTSGYLTYQICGTTISGGSFKTSGVVNMLYLTLHPLHGNMCSPRELAHVSESIQEQVSQGVCSRHISKEIKLPKGYKKEVYCVKAEFEVSYKKHRSSGLRISTRETVVPNRKP